MLDQPIAWKFSRFLLLTLCPSVLPDSIESAFRVPMAVDPETEKNFLDPDQVEEKQSRKKALDRRPHGKISNHRLSASEMFLFISGR